MPKLTIHTATYNRAYILPKAYESLKAQTCKDFEWLITDDGSNDGTEKLVKEWQKNDNGFDIIYNKLEHVGVPRALNFGVSKANSDWFMMLDSDDHLLPETVEKVILWVNEIANDKAFAGVGFAKCFPNGEYMKSQTPKIDKTQGYVDASHLERAKYNIDMDMCEVHRTSLMKSHPFQYFGDEKFAPEQLCLYNIALDGYKLRWRADKQYICEYLEDGLTKSDSIVKNNPMGYAMMYNQNLLFTKSFKKNINNVLQMTALSLYAGHPKYLKQSNKKALTYILFPFGWMLSKRRKRQFKEMRD